MSQYRYEQKIDSPMTRDETAAWSQIENSFRAAQFAAPRKGFANRWMQVQYRHQLLERKHREAWLALGNATAIFAILGVIVVTLIPSFGLPGSILSSVIDFLLGTLTFLLMVVEISVSFLGAIPLLIWFTVALAFFALIAFWASLFSRVAMGNR